MEYISEIICAILGFLAGITVTIHYQKKNKSYEVKQNKNKAKKIVGRDDNSRN
ncbi:hypothetical protein ACK2M2_13670 [Acinetobacter sp. TY1]|uniref:hypothetical protein n=1 Tax=Acinetobacter sp. TY1 TaxID=3387626 RepID=UPI003AF56B1F